MPAITRQDFSRLLGTLERTEFVRFVADLWELRGHETDIDGNIVVAYADGEQTVVRVRHDASLWGRLRRAFGTPEKADADIVVTSGQPPAETDDLGVEDVYEMVFYAIDRGDSESLLESYFGRRATVPGALNRTRRVPRLLSRTGAMLAVVVLVLIVVVLAAVLGGVGGLLSTTQPPAGAETVTERKPGDVSTTRTTTSSEYGRGALALARAHEDLLADQSVTVRVTRTVRNTDRSVVERRVLTGKFAPDSRRYEMSLSRTRAGRLETRRVLWSDGERTLRVVTTDNRTRYGVVRDLRSVSAAEWELLQNPLFVDPLIGVLGTIESAEASLQNRGPPDDEMNWAPPTLDSTLEDGTPPTLASLLGHGPKGDPLLFAVRANLSERAVSRLVGGGKIEDANLTAVLGSRGRFHTYTITYSTTLGGNHMVVTRTVNYTRVGETTVDRPSWYAEALNASRPAADYRRPDVPA